MADTSARASPPSRPRRGLRYSLRALLILITLAGIATWYWFRVPYSVEFDSSSRGWWAGERSDETGKRIERFRRVLWGKPTREGQTEYYYKSGAKRGIEQWREGARHGPCMHWFANGRLYERGQYAVGVKQGTWEQFDKAGNLRRQIHYDQGAPHGSATWHSGGKPIRTIVFDQGEVVRFDGKPVSDPLGRVAWKSAKELSQQEIENLRFLLDVDVYQPKLDLRLDHFAEHLHDYGAHVAIDPRWAPAASKQISINADHMTLGVMLLAALEPHDLKAVYRFGHIWITTKEDAETWVDRSGVPELLAHPPAFATADDVVTLRNVLEEPASINLVAPASKLPAAIEYAVGNQLTILWAGPTPGPTITAQFNSGTLRQLLGAVCDQNNLRVRWAEGTTLVIEPRDEPEP